MCGGTLWESIQAQWGTGLSPRVRGNLIVLRPSTFAKRSIPACAGEPRSGPNISEAQTVYPRVCGGTPRPLVLWRHRSGLSPRVRGNRNLRLLYNWESRSIPACAGEPSLGEVAPSGHRVYPRVCGGTELITRNIVPESGLSPRVRGNP